ncbi:hypothetical protein SAMN05216369_3091 [Marinobacter antarcticus]|uniref:Uncharacterized protein n=1 Tax=Marinobacter antarcticus TaxID=564117 RepID=A0A1M6V4P0_9GAMM|nr:hypothetical protein SAMN05216369_3091 [Marinobacter antarcticus]
MTGGSFPKKIPDCAFVLESSADILIARVCYVFLLWVSVTIFEAAQTVLQ